MSDVYAEHVALLMSGSRVTEDSVRAVLDALRQDAQRRLRARGAWHHPPARFGYADHSNWRNDDALTDLATDAYYKCLVERLQHLHGAALEGADVAVLVRQNLDHMLIDRQRTHDGLGYRVYKNVQAGVRLHTGSESPDATEIVLTGAPSTDNEPVGAAQLREALRAIPGWQALAGELGSRTGDAAEDVARCIQTLGDSGVRAFRVGDLVDLAKEQAAGFRATRLIDPGDQVAAEPSEDGDGVIPVLFVVPPTRHEELAYAADVLARMAGFVRRLPQHGRHRDKLTRILDAIAILVAEPSVNEISLAIIASTTSLPRSTVADLMPTVRALFERVRAEDPSTARRLH